MSALALFLVVVTPMGGIATHTSWSGSRFDKNVLSAITRSSRTQLLNNFFSNSALWTKYMVYIKFDTLYVPTKRSTRATLLTFESTTSTSSTLNFDPSIVAKPVPVFTTLDKQNLKLQSSIRHGIRARRKDRAHHFYLVLVCAHTHAWDPMWPCTCTRSCTRTTISSMHNLHPQQM